MKELEAISINEGAVLTEDGLKANGEVILIYSEPVYHSGECAELGKKRHTNCLRLGMSPDRMRHFASKLQQAADTMSEHFHQAMQLHAAKLAQNKTNDAAAD